MPIEIKELHIKVNVNQSENTRPATPAAGAGEASGGGNKQAIIAECVEQVLNILKKQKER